MKREMEKKAVSGIMLTLLFLGMLTLAFKIKLVSAIVPLYPAIYVDPPIVENIMPGNNVTVSINTNYTGLISAYQFTLSYNASVLHGINVTNGDIITTDKTPLAQFIPGTFDNTEGTLSLTGAFIFIVDGPIPSVWGPGTLADVTFTVVGYGTSNITLGPETRLWGWPPYPWEDPPIILDAESMPDHIGHGFFSNKIPGDIDGDYYVGSADFSILAGAYGTSVGNPVYVPEADINCDGYIGSADLSILAGNYGTSI